MTKISVVLLFFLSTLSFSQELNYIYGKVIDSKTGAPLAFASIVQKDKSVGLISNSDGSFKIPAYYYTADVTIEISFIGYYSEEISVRELDRNGLNTIKLIEKTELLNEVVISKEKNLNATQIVRLAIQNINNNYPQDTFSYVGYYRDYQKDQNSFYLNMNEAILQVHDLGFNYEDYVSTKTQIFQYAENRDFPRDSIASQSYNYTNKTKIIDNAILGHIGKQVNEFELLRIHDAIRNYDINTYDFVNQLNTDFIKNHSFEIKGTTSFKKNILYEIKLYKDLENYTAEGTIFISKGDYKIYKLVYALFKKERTKKKKSSRYDRHSYLGNNKTEVPSIKKELIFNVLVEYAEHSEIMYPKYISFNNPFNIVKPPKFVPLEAKFTHKKEGYDRISVAIEIAFNNKITPSNEIYKKRNYTLIYNNNKIRIDKIVLNDIKNTVILYPKEKDVTFYKDALAKGMKLKDEFYFEVKNLEDVDGNVVFENEKASYHQYREFFVQELNFGLTKPKDSLFMIKTQPIFLEQPIAPSKDLSQYWMNTPLKRE